MMTKMREEVAADYKAASFTPNVIERRRMQSETLAAVFETYFRILKHTMQSTTARSEANDISVASASGPHRLLSPCLNGFGKFFHLIDLDFIGDLMNYLKKLAAGNSNSDSSSEKCLKRLTVSERLRCCIVAFKVMRSNLDAFNVDLQDFFVQLYNLILEYWPGRDQGEVLAEALKIMLCDDRPHDMQRAAAFVKRLATFSLCFGSAESMAALVTLKHLLQKNVVKCRNLLENDAGGGSVSGSIARSFLSHHETKLFYTSQIHMACCLELKKELGQFIKICSHYLEFGAWANWVTMEDQNEVEGRPVECYVRETVLRRVHPIRNCEITDEVNLQSEEHTSCSCF